MNCAMLEFVQDRTRSGQASNLYSAHYYQRSFQRQKLRGISIHLSRLSLTGFRNHTNTDLELRPGLTLFQGNNGEGKSNLLEAAYMLAIAKSSRASNDRELVNWSVAESGGHMQVLGVGRDGDTTIQAQIDVDVTAAAASASAGFRKGLRVNGIKRSATDFVGSLNVVFFEADDLEIIHGSPGRRRRYLDILIAQSDPAYLKSLQRYGQVVSQRHQLLRRIREEQESPILEEGRSTALTNMPYRRTPIFRTAVDCNLNTGQESQHRLVPDRKNHPMSVR